ncbi:MAG: hypothetical protein QXT86_10450 [Archaeoglobaceae archaeon]
MINVKLEYTDLLDAIRDIELDHEQFADVLQQLANELQLNIDMPPPFTKNVEVNPEDPKTLYDFVVMNNLWHRYVNEVIRVIGSVLTPPVIVVPKLFFTTRVDEFLVFERIMHMDIDNFLNNL